MVAWASLAGAWHFLKQWYLYHSLPDYFAFAVMTAAAIVAACGLLILELLRTVTCFRILTFCVFAAVALPWPEWLQSDGNYTNQFFLQCVILYACFCLFFVVDVLRRFFSSKFQEFLKFFSSRDWPFKLSPLIFLSICTFFTVFYFRLTPIFQESTIHLFQARIFRQLQLVAPLQPSLSQFFSVPESKLILNDAGWFSSYPPGYAALLAVFSFANLGWLVPALLSSASLAIWIAYLHRWHSKEAASLFTILYFFSPLFLITSCTTTLHTAELFFASATLYLCRLQSEHPATARSHLLFVVLLVAIPTGGMELFVFLLPIVGYMVWLRRSQPATASGISVGLMAGAVLLGLYYVSTLGKTELLQVAGQFWSESPLRGLLSISSDLHALDLWLTGWHSGALIFIATGILFLPAQNWDRAVFASFVLLTIFYFFFPDGSTDLIPSRFYVLTPFALSWITRIILFDFPRPGRSKIMGAVVTILLLTCIAERLPELLHRGLAHAFEAAALKRESQNIRDERYVILLDAETKQEFVSWNDPFLRGNIIFSRDLQEKNQELISYFAGYRNGIFRKAMTPMFQAGKGFAVFPMTDQVPKGYVSIFDLVLVLQNEEDPARDIFDNFYSYFSRASALKLRYVEAEIARPIDGPEYKRYFRLGVLVTAAMILRPKVALEEGGPDTIQPDLLRADNQHARALLGKSGEVGVTILTQLDKVHRRIDQDRDGWFSDYEIRRFLSRKSIWIKRN